MFLLHEVYFSKHAGWCRAMCLLHKVYSGWTFFSAFHPWFDLGPRLQTGVERCVYHMRYILGGSFSKHCTRGSGIVLRIVYSWMNVFPSFPPGVWSWPASTDWCRAMCLSASHFARYLGTCPLLYGF